jgi:hypothetical protein
LPSSPSGGDYDFEFLPEVAAEAKALPEDIRREIARIVVELHSNPYLGDSMDDRPPRVLQGCRKVRFDVPGHRGKPRYRLIYRNEPSDGAVGLMVVLSIGERRNMIAYANAAARFTKREARGHVRRRDQQR